ncbi:MAG: RsmE family RNA methyltransferase [Candidatus Binataceae bacterium]
MNSETTNRAPRFVIARGALHDGFAEVDGAELHHMRDVTRVAPGAEVALLAADGLAYWGRLVRYEPGHALIEIRGQADREASSAILILAPAIIKGPRMDFMVEKAAELGVAELWPLVCTRGVVRAPGAERMRRWRRLAFAAAKQSLAARAMMVGEPLTIAELGQKVAKETLALVCAAGAEPFAAMIRSARPRAILIACGPEGDFDPAEYAALKAAGFAAAGLGPNRLRSETAALAALSVTIGALYELTGETKTWLISSPL